MDENSADFLKACEQVSAHHLQVRKIFAFFQGLSPDCLKFGTIKTKYKFASEQKFENYRPITAPPPFNKKPERTMYDCIQLS